MSKILTINLQSSSPSTLSFFIFQEPATYSGGASVYSTCLYAQTLSSMGGGLSFQVDTQNYAGIKQTDTAPKVGGLYVVAEMNMPIDLATSDGTATMDTIAATVSPLGLETPTHGSGLQPGSFRITTPSFTTPPFVIIGNAVEANRSIILSSFVQATPETNIDCQPNLKFYVAEGNYLQGDVIDVRAASVTAALCDFSHGATSMDVEFTPMGEWSVSNEH